MERLLDVQLLEPIEEGEGYAADQEVDVARLLIIAIERHPWQRRHMIRVLGEQLTRPRGNRTLEAKLGGDIEIASAGSSCPSVWISEMLGTLAEFFFQPVGIFRDVSLSLGGIEAPDGVVVTQDCINVYQQYPDR